MVKFFDNFLNFIFPPICPVCKDSVCKHGELCVSCWNKFNWISNPKCYKCGYPFPANIDLGENPMCPKCISNGNKLDFIRSACVYDDFSKTIVLPFKYSSKLEYITFMAKAMINVLKELNLTVDIVIPVPLSFRRLFKRGYNQAALLAKPIANYYGAIIDVDIISRKYASDMGHKTFKQRYKNIHNVFKINKPEKLYGKTVLLVDDVMTSGATFYELNRVLRRYNVKSVYAVSFCRTVQAL